MTIERVVGTAVARIGDTVIASSDRALRVLETAGRAFGPVIYFPPADVRAQRLRPLEKTTYCPLKGTAAYYDVDLDDGPVAEAAWSYQDTLTFDPRLTQLESCVAFDRKLVAVEVDAD